MDEEESLGFGEGLEESEVLFEDNRKRYLSDEETETIGMIIIINQIIEIILFPYIEPQSKIQCIDYTNVRAAYPSIHDDIIRVVNTSGDCIYLSVKNERHLHNNRKVLVILVF